LQIITLGRGAVITCSPNRLEWAQAELGKLDREALFSPATLGLINRFVAQEGQFLEGPDLKFLCAPDTFRPHPAPAGIELELVATREEIARLYAYQGFNNALGHRLDGPRPDVLAAVARQAGQVIGIAGVSADSDKLWQIGIDVVEPYRGRGIGKALVSAATEASMAQGKIPYYSTSLTNLRSSSIAAGLGYWLTWLEAYTRELK
jgi:GNAT superfamily N-acetyltransferase